MVERFLNKEYENMGKEVCSCGLFHLIQHLSQMIERNNEKPQ